VSFWDYAAFVVNSLIFLRWGMLRRIQNSPEVLLPIGIALFCHCGRALSTYHLLSCSWVQALKVKTSHQARALSWGGLRGAWPWPSRWACHQHLPLPRRRSDRGLRRGGPIQ